MTQKTQARAAGQSTAFLLLLGGIFVLLNCLGLFFNLRSDWTEKRLFSLSTGSKHLASSLKDRMEIVGYFSADLPPPHNATERYVRDLLTEYKDASRGKIALRFIHPEKDEDKQAAERDGVHRVQDQKLEADSFSVHEGFRGIAFRYLGDTRAIAQVDDSDGLEYSITQIIKELTGEKVKIGVIAGHNEEPPPNPMQMQMGQPPQGGVKLNSLKAYLPTYTVSEVKADKEIPGDLKALLIVQPDKPFTDSELRYIDQFVMKGGSLAIFGGSLKVEMSQAPTGSAMDTGLNKLLDKWGLSLGGQVVADAQCGRARMPTQFGIPMAVPYPPVPIITFEDYQRKHPVLFRLDQTAMPYAAPITLTDTLKGDKEVKRTVLAQSTKNSWLMEGASIDLKARERWEIPKTRQSFVVGVALEGKLPSAFAAVPASTPEGGDKGAAPTNIQAPARAEKSVHVLVLGSGFFMRDEFMPQPQAGSREIPGGAGALALNAIDWLAQDSDLIEIRAKSVEDPSLEVPQNVKEAEVAIREAVGQQDQEKADKAFKERKESMAAWDAKKASYRWANTLGLPLALALFGVIRWRVRKATRANLKL